MATEGAVATAVAWQLTGMVDYVEYQLMFFFFKFISYVASYVGPIQTGFLMTFRKSYDGTGIMFPVKKNITGAGKTGIRRIPTGITNLAHK